MDREVEELVLANRQFVWGLIARGFAEEPDRAFADIIEGEHAREEVSLVEDDRSDEIASLFTAAVGRLAESRQGATAAGEGADELAQAREDYTRIFVGPNTLLASPWETMHTTG